MARYTKNEVRSIVATLEMEARVAGILPDDHRLVYNAGSPSNGITATVMVQGPDGNYVHGYDRFIPEFNYKMASSEQFRLIESAVNVFYALRLQLESAAKAAREQLAARGL
jgi:hypothetical protein